jgi:hypothetical protein
MFGMGQHVEDKKETQSDTCGPTVIHTSVRIEERAVVKPGFDSQGRQGLVIHVVEVKEGIRHRHGNPFAKLLITQRAIGEQCFHDAVAFIGIPRVTLHESEHLQGFTKLLTCGGP